MAGRREALIRILILLAVLSGAGNCLAETLTIEKTLTIPKFVIADNVELGGISDLISFSDKTFYIITDRGPNGKIQTPEGKFRNLLSPEFKPRIYKIFWNDYYERFLLADVEYIKGVNGLCTGKPNSVKVKKILNAEGTEAITPDTDGVDPEGLVLRSNGEFIITEEYGPSIIYNDTGKRYTPLNQHRDNRGFEAVALSADEKYLWTMLQSPVNEEDKTIPFIIFDMQTGKIDRRINYRLEEDTVDGKICCMRRYDMLDNVLVLEQSDTTPAKLFLFNTKNEKKELFASLENILPEMANDITEGATETTGLKLEGMDILPDGRIAIVNDNDFDEDKNNCLWILNIEP